MYPNGAVPNYHSMAPFNKVFQMYPPSEVPYFYSYEKPVGSIFGVPNWFSTQLPLDQMFCRRCSKCTQMVQYLIFNPLVPFVCNLVNVPSCCCTQFPTEMEVQQKVLQMYPIGLVPNLNLNNWYPFMKYFRCTQLVQYPISLIQQSCRKFFGVPNW